MKRLLIVPALAMVGFSACNSNDNSNSSVQPGDQTVVQTTQFLQKTANQRYQSNGVSLNIGSDASYELLINSEINSQVNNSTQYDVAKCNIRVRGTATYYAQKATVISSQSNSIQNKLLELNITSAKVLSGKLINPSPAGPKDPSGESLCSSYANALSAEGALRLTLDDYEQDHLVVAAYSQFLTIAPQGGYSSSSNLPQFWLNNVARVGMNDAETYFVKGGATVDVTTLFLTRYNDSTYASDVIGTGPGQDLTADIDAGLKEITLASNTCGMKYIIDINSISTDGSNTVLKGAIADSVEPDAQASPAGSNPGNSSGSTTAPSSDLTSACDQLQAIAHNAAQGIDIGGESDICVDNSCTGEKVYKIVRLGKPATTASDGTTYDSITLNFESAPQALKD